VAFGCRRQPNVPPPEPEPRIAPLPVQQTRAYPETVTGLFLSLADFEDSPSGPRGDQQVGHFSIGPPGKGACRFVVNITRTGAGAMEVLLHRGAELVFDVPDVHDFTGFTLLSVALYAEALRDDFRVTLATSRAEWTSHRNLVKAGWNTVLVDIQRLAQAENFDITDVRKVRFAFADAAGPVTFNVDDIMVIDNRRAVRPAPSGLKLLKSGLDYTLTLPRAEKPVRLAKSPDGLWRLGGRQALVQLAGPGVALAESGEQLALMGDRRLGAVELLEHNPGRVRLANTWYFPTRVGEWASLAVRQIRWEYTFYADARWVTHVQLNQAGGRQIGTLRIRLPQQVAWALRGVADELLVSRFAGTVGRWSYLTAPAGLRRETMLRNYVRPGRIRIRMGADGAFAPGDADHDGFDESQGCYWLAAKAGHCRFTISPPPGGLIDPLFRVAGRWTGDVRVNSEGLTIRNVVRLADGSVLFVVPGFLRRPTDVEVVGKVPLLADE